MAEEDIILTFNISAFKQGIDKASNEVTGFVKTTESTVNKIVSKIPNIGKKVNKESKETQKTAKKTSKGILSSFGKLALIGGIIAGSVALIKKAIKSIPEIGMTFKAVGRIVTKNLLWPLRKELVPILQRVLDWTRNNRAMFVKWGGVIVNVLKAVKTLFVTVLNLIKTLINSLKTSLKDLVNFAGIDITNIINLLVFKLVALFLLLEAKLEPLFEFIGKGIGEISIIFNDFFKELEKIGVLNSFYEILKGIADIVQRSLILGFESLKVSLKLVTSLLSGFFEGLFGIDDLDKKFETFIGHLKEAFDQVTKLVNILGEKLEPAFNLLGKAIGFLVGNALKLLLASFTQITKDLESLLGFANKLISGDFGNKKSNKTTNVDDAIIRPDGTVIRTNPEDTLVALKRPQEAMSNIHAGQKITVQVEGININVTEGNAEQAGINFGMGIEQQMRQVVLDQRTGSGDR